MGAGQSARKLTINNENELGVIHISSGVAQRLAQGIASTNKGGSVADTRHGVGSDPMVQPVQHNTSQTSGRQAVQSSPVPSDTYPVHIQPEYTVSALKMHQQKEEELSKQQLYWQKRLENLKANHAKIDRILQDEYQRAVDQVASAQGKKKVDVNSVVPPCIENKEKVLQCYQNNPKETLKCSSLVEEFSNCVNERRGTLIAARC